jgi:hypothetical protein
MAADAPDKRIPPCPEGLPGSPKRAGVHHIRMDARYTCRIWSGPCLFCAHRVLRYLPTLGRLEARLQINNSLTFGPYKSGDIVVPRIVSLVRAGGGASRPCGCTGCLGEAWASAAARLTRAASPWGAVGPAAHVCLCYVHVARRRGRPANALRSTNQPSDHGDHCCQEACARRPRQAARTIKHGFGTPHRHRGKKCVPLCQGRLLLLCARCAPTAIPSLGRMATATCL